MAIRGYRTEDYPQLVALYKQGDLYGGQFDEHRDSEERLARKITNDPEAILVYEEEGKIIGTVSLIEDERVAWLFRFAVKKGKNEQGATKALWNKAEAILRNRGHQQVLIYAPANTKNFEDRYTSIGFKKGNVYTCYWQNIESID